MSEGDCVPKNKYCTKGHKIPSKDTQGIQSDKLMRILHLECQREIVSLKIKIPLRDTKFHRRTHKGHKVTN